MTSSTAGSDVPALEISNLNVWFGTSHRSSKGQESHAVKALNLKVMPGERVGLVGESGCGKTTTILSAMGLLPSTASVSGEVLLNGVDIISGGESGMASHRWREIAMVFQGAMSAFNPVKTIGWQIIEALRIHNVVGEKQSTSRAIELLGLVGLKPNVLDLYPHQLSGGMKQRAMIAMAIACEPKVLLADEPTTALDVVIQDQILNLLTSLTEELNLALVLVTHDLGVVAQSCDRAAVMLGGQIVEEGAIEKLWKNPSHEYTRKLFNSTPDLASALEKRKSSGSEKKATLLEVRDLSVKYENSPPTTDSRKLAVDGVNFDVRAGELVALVGESGCGKTTTVQAIMGMVDIQAGEIRVSGEDTVRLRPSARKQLRRSMQLIYQDPYEALDVRFRVKDTVEEPLVIHGIGGNRASRLQLIIEALEEVGLTPASAFLNRFPHELSGGQRQRVAIAASIVLRPKVLLADEPVSMLDVTLRSGVLDLLDRLRSAHDMGILMVTHDLSTAIEHADRILVMRDGKIEEEGTSNAILNSPRSSYTRLLLDSVPSPNPDSKRGLVQKNLVS